MRVASEEERRWLCETWWEKCQESCEAVARARLVFLRQVGRLRLSLRTSEHTLPSLSPGQFFHMTVQPVIARPMMAGAIFLKYSLPCAIFLTLCLVLCDAVPRQKSMTSLGQWWRRSSRDGGMLGRVHTCESMKRSARSQRRWRRLRTTTGFYIQQPLLDFSHPLSLIFSLFFVCCLGRQCWFRCLLCEAIFLVASDHRLLLIVVLVQV